MIMKFDYRYVKPIKPLKELSNFKEISKKYDSKEDADNLFVYLGDEYSKHGVAFTNLSLMKELGKEGKTHDIILITDYLGYEPLGLFQTNRQLVSYSKLNYTTAMNFLLEDLPGSNFYAMGLTKYRKRLMAGHQNKETSRIKLINNFEELEGIINEIKPVVSICFNIKAKIGLNDVIKTVELLKERKEIRHVDLLGYGKYVQNCELKIMENFHKALVSEELVIV